MTSLLVGLLFLACGKDSNKEPAAAPSGGNPPSQVESDPKPGRVAPEPGVVGVEDPGGAAKDLAVPAAWTTEELESFVARTIIGHDPDQKRIAVFEIGVGSEEFYEVAVYELGTNKLERVEMPASPETRWEVEDGSAESVVGAKDFHAQTRPALLAALAGFKPVKGGIFEKQSASPPSFEGTVRFADANKVLTVKANSKKAMTRKLDGGGVTTPEPTSAFAIPGVGVVVLVHYQGDVVVSEDAELFSE